MLSALKSLPPGYELARAIDQVACSGTVPQDVCSELERLTDTIPRARQIRALLGLGRRRFLDGDPAYAAHFAVSIQRIEKLPRDPGRAALSIRLAIEAGVPDDSRRRLLDDAVQISLETIEPARSRTLSDAAIALSAIDLGTADGRARCLDIARSVPSERRRATTLSQVAVALAGCGNLPAAIEVSREAVDAAIAIPSEQGPGSALIDSAGAAARVQIEPAELVAALDSARPVQRLRMLVQMAEGSEAAGSTESSLRYANRAISTWHEMKSKASSAANIAYLLRATKIVSAEAYASEVADALDEACAGRLRLTEEGLRFVAVASTRLAPTSLDQILVAVSNVSNFDHRIDALSEVLEAAPHAVPAAVSAVHRVVEQQEALTAMPLLITLAARQALLLKLLLADSVEQRSKSLAAIRGLGYRNLGLDDSTIEAALEPDAMNRAVHEMLLRDGVPARTLVSVASYLLPLNATSVPDLYGLCVWVSQLQMTRSVGARDSMDLFTSSAHWLLRTVEPGFSEVLGAILHIVDEATPAELRRSRSRRDDPLRREWNSARLEISLSLTERDAADAHRVAAAVEIARGLPRVMAAKALRRIAVWVAAADPAAAREYLAEAERLHGSVAELRHAQRDLESAVAIHDISTGAGSQLLDQLANATNREKHELMARAAGAVVRYDLEHGESIHRGIRIASMVPSGQGKSLALAEVVWALCRWRSEEVGWSERGTVVASEIPDDPVRLKALVEIAETIATQEPEAAWRIVSQAAISPGLTSDDAAFERVCRLDLLSALRGLASWLYSHKVAIVEMWPLAAAVLFDTDE
jgi:hypothetical protein